MAKKIIKARLKQRTDTQANWTANNPVLLEGELGLVTDDKNLYKVGDGVTAWNDLPFRGFDGTLVHETGDSDNAVMSQRSVTEALNELKERMVEKVPGKGLSTEDYTTEEKEKLAGLQNFNAAEIQAKLTQLSEGIGEKEDKANKTTTLSSASTDTQYPSAKAVFTAITNVGSGKQGVIRQKQTWTQAADKGYDYAMTDIVRGAISQANIDLLASVGIVFNEGSGYFELNGMTDLSYEEAMAVYSKTSAFSQGCISASGVGLGGVFEAYYGYYRCNAPMLPYRLYMQTQANFSYLCWNNRFIERLFLYNYTSVFVKDFTSAFDGCFRLKEVQGLIELKNSAANYTSAFLNCYSLESISLRGIKANLNFAQSARLGNASILFMINNEVATSAITITLHADAYARAMSDAEITAALAAHPNVSLAKA